MKPMLLLFAAIAFETFATSTLKASEQFTKLWPSLGAVAGYAVAFYLLSLTLKDIPVGVAYAIWSGAGIVLISLFAFLFFRQTLDAPAIIGMFMIVGGVVVINVFSNSVAH